MLYIEDFSMCHYAVFSHIGSHIIVNIEMIQNFSHHTILTCVNMDKTNGQTVSLIHLLILCGEYRIAQNFDGGILDSSNN